MIIDKTTTAPGTGINNRSVISDLGLSARKFASNIMKPVTNNDDNRNLYGVIFSKSFSTLIANDISKRWNKFLIIKLC